MGGDIPKKSELRGIFGNHGDSKEWLNSVSKFPNGVPRFDSKQEALDFMKEYNQHHGGSNPDNPHLQHIFTTLVGWGQIEKYLLPALEKARQEPSDAPNVPRSYGDTPDDASDNVYEKGATKEVMDAIAQRLEVPFHRTTTVVSTLNTLRYLFFHMKCGILVVIRNGHLRIFAPFVNDDYRNTWADRLKIEGDDSLDLYYTQKAGLYREEQIEPDRSKWWANGNIICNELTKLEDKEMSQHWGDHFLAPLRDMLAEACRLRQLPDCEFFLNKRDYPQLKVNTHRGVPVEPYGFIFDKGKLVPNFVARGPVSRFTALLVLTFHFIRDTADDRDETQDVDLVDEHKFKSYAPIVSFYAAAPDRFTDIPFPSSEDWEAACGKVFAHTFMHSTNKAGEIEMNGSPRYGFLTLSALECLRS